MAQLDFCFTYYDADAARDKAHMNRLERGAYDDLISAQRKFGHLSKKIIQKVLSDDFEKCWESLELILKIDTAGNFFIEWLDTSVNKSKLHSEHQKANVLKRWNKVGNTKKKIGNTTVLPLEDGNGNGNGIEKEIESENGNKLAKVDVIKLPFETPAFKELWLRWVDYRRQIKKPYKTTVSEQAALKALSKFDEPFSVMLIERSIANQWQGLIFEKTPEEFLNYKSNGTIRTTPEGKRIPKWGTGLDALRRDAEERAGTPSTNVV